MAQKHHYLIDKIKTTTMKKHMLISIFVLITHLVIGQDTIFLNDNYEEIKSFKEASFFKTIEKIDTDKIVERLYNTSGKCKSESEFKITKNDEKVLDGERKVYFDTGELRVLAYFTNGKKDGEFISYWKNGNLKRKDLYKKGKLKKGDCWDENGEKVKYYDFEIQPELSDELQKRDKKAMLKKLSHSDIQSGKVQQDRD